MSELVNSNPNIVSPNEEVDKPADPRSRFEIFEKIRQIFQERGRLGYSARSINLVESQMPQKSSSDSETIAGIEKKRGQVIKESKSHSVIKALLAAAALAAVPLATAGCFSATANHSEGTLPPEPTPPPIESSTNAGSRYDTFESMFEIQDQTPLTGYQVFDEKIDGSFEQYDVYSEGKRRPESVMNTEGALNAIGTNLEEATPEELGIVADQLATYTRGAIAAANAQFFKLNEKMSAFQGLESQKEYEEAIKNMTPEEREILTNSLKEALDQTTYEKMSFKEAKEKYPELEGVLYNTGIKDGSLREYKDQLISDDAEILVAVTKTEKETIIRFTKLDCANIYKLTIIKTPTGINIIEIEPEDPTPTPTPPEPSPTPDPSPDPTPTPEGKGNNPHAGKETKLPGTAEQKDDSVQPTSDNRSNPNIRPGSQAGGSSSFDSFDGSTSSGQDTGATYDSDTSGWQGSPDSDSTTPPSGANSGSAEADSPNRSPEELSNIWNG